MTTVQEIENAVTLLPKPELDKFCIWFEKSDANVWDKQFEEDVQTGKLDRMADQALKDLPSRRISLVSG
jgi:hypothetical protein